SFSLYTFLSTPRSPPALPPLSLHDALPIWPTASSTCRRVLRVTSTKRLPISITADSAWVMTSLTCWSTSSNCSLEKVDQHVSEVDRKSTRLNSSHVKISYAVFCLKKKKKTT